MVTRRSERVAKRALELGAIPALFFAARDAHAEMSATVNPGPLFSTVWSEETYVGVGGELSFLIYASEIMGVGGFSQFQSYDGDFGRYALGVQAGSFLGAELGYAYREGHARVGGGHGLHAAIFGSIGLAALSVRSTVPLSSKAEAGEDDPAFELALGLTLKFPLPIGDNRVPWG